MEAQLNRVVELLRETFGEALAGAYLFGSAAQGGLKPARATSTCWAFSRGDRPARLQRARDLYLGDEYGTGTTSTFTTRRSASPS